MDYDGFEPAPFFWIEEVPTQVSTRKRQYNKKKRIYVGWASRELIEFLESIGKDTTKALSQQDVTAIINQYVQDKILVNPAKKKRVFCDQKLQSLFGRKQSIARNKIFDLLDSHLVENRSNSDEDQSGSPDENDEDAVTLFKKQRNLTIDTKTQPKKKAPEVLKNCLAAINAENIKLVFLRRSLVQELLKVPEEFENKVVGSFVRVKSDPHDIFQKNSHELHLVTGVTDVAPIDNKRSTLVQISRMEDNIDISELSDENFSEEEIEDLRRRVQDGSLKHPTVGELGIKVAALHEDITKQWLAKELILLKNLIDRANEKGWRYKVAEYSDRRKLLESPSEQSRLFSETPNVMPEDVKADIIDESSPDDSPKAVDWDWEPYDVPSTNGVTKKLDVFSELVGQGAAEICTRSNGDAHHSSGHEERNQPGTSLTAAINNGHDQFVDLNERETSNSYEVPSIGYSNGHTEFFNPNHSNIGNLENQQASNGHMKFPTSKEPEKAPVVIDLSDDEEEELKHQSGESGDKIPRPHPELPAWFYFDPQGRVQGPFSLTSLMRWNDLKYFSPDFKVWVSGQSPHEAILLSDVLQ